MRTHICMMAAGLGQSMENRFERIGRNKMNENVMVKQFFLKEK